MAGNAYSTYTGNVSMTPAGQEALIAKPTTAPPVSSPPANTGTGTHAGSMSKLNSSLGTPIRGTRSPFGTWSQPK